MNVAGIVDATDRCMGTERHLRRRRLATFLARLSGTESGTAPRRRFRHGPRHESDLAPTSGIAIGVVVGILVWALAAALILA
jgi:hypothetical protein